MKTDLMKDEWIKRVLGVSRPLPRSGPEPTPEKKVRFAPVTMLPPSPPGVRLGEGRPRSDTVIAPPVPQPPQHFTGEGGRTLSVAKSKTGGVVFTAPPPPVREVTFSGGGGKGMALPGAVRALEKSGVLKDAKSITGASVGSMTAALVASGISAEEFETIANAQSTTDRIVEGTGGTKSGLAKRAIQNKWNTGDASPLTGQGLEDVVREAIDTTLNKRMQEYSQSCIDAKKPPHDDVVRIAKKLATDKAGASFMDMRQLSAIIPAIKEIVITGTYITELGTIDEDSKKDFKNQNESGQLYVFSADSEPDLPVAIAVHASASFPAAFKPVDITLASGLKVRFVDGGAMNNTPTSASIGNERKLDPMPEGRGISFVFEDEGGVSSDLLKGKVKPSVGKMARVIDWFVGADFSGAEYGKDSNLAERPEEIVVVPLKLTLPPKKPGGKGKVVDMRGGTLEFNVAPEAKIAFQNATEQATKDQIDRENQPKGREFASDSQMFVSIGIADLKTLDKSGYPGAAEALVFRTRVADMIQKLVDGVTKATKKDGGKTADALKDKDVTMALDELDKLAGDDVDFQGYVGREMNKGSLDNLIAAMDKKKPTKVLQAVFAVSDAVRVQTSAGYILKDVVYPKMKRQNEGGSGLQTLLQVENLLKAARTPEELNSALTVGIKHFKTKSDTRPVRGHKQLALDLEKRLMKIAA